MFVRLAALTVLVLLLSACASGPRQLTLVESKSPVQLLRNEAWYRLPAVMVKGDFDTEDVSVACNNDPAGLLRLWRSSTIALVNNSFAPRAVGMADTLALTFEEQGWTAERAESDLSVVTVLNHEESVAVIEIEAVLKTSDHRASVRITTFGPCVMTQGPESDEVVSLERR